MIFAKRLKDLRDEKNLSQTQLGREIGISGRGIGYYETGDRFPKDEELLKKFADFFGVSMDYLMGMSSIRNYDDVKFAFNSTEELNEDDIETVQKIIDGLIAKKRKED
jgi:transcriptional regulator with XRE-family HTH domain